MLVTVTAQWYHLNILYKLKENQKFYPQNYLLYGMKFYNSPHFSLQVKGDDSVFHPPGGATKVLLPHPPPADGRKGTKRVRRTGRVDGTEIATNRSGKLLYLYIHNPHYIIFCLTNHMLPNLMSQNFY